MQSLYAGEATSFVVRTRAPFNSAPRSVSSVTTCAGLPDCSPSSHSFSSFTVVSTYRTSRRTGIPFPAQRSTTDIGSPRNCEICFHLFSRALAYGLRRSLDLCLVRMTRLLLRGAAVDGASVEAAGAALHDADRHGWASSSPTRRSRLPIGGQVRALEFDDY